jgi:antitoxin HicB
MKTEIVKDLAYYAALPYTIVLRRDEEGDVTARVEELQGCVAHGKNVAEALEILEEFKQAWIERAIESGQIVPEPEPEDGPLPSGKWVQRVPRSLHQRLVKMAKREGVSLNQLVTSMLSNAASSRAVEKVVEDLLARFVGPTARSFASYQHAHGNWDALILEPGNADELDWSMDRTPVDPLMLCSVARMMPKHLRVKHAIEAIEEVER